MIYIEKLEMEQRIRMISRVDASSPNLYRWRPSKQGRAAAVSQNAIAGPAIRRIHITETAVAFLEDDGQKNDRELLCCASNFSTSRNVISTTEKFQNP
jgi:hypothetical protein